METRTSELVTLNVALSTLCHNIRLKLFHLKLREHIVRSKLDSSQNSDPPTGGPSFKLLIGLSVSRLIASAWVPDSNSVIAATVVAARRQRCFLIKFGGGAGDGRCSFHSSWHNSLECPYDAIHLIRHSIDPSMMWEWILSCFSLSKHHLSASPGVMSNLMKLTQFWNSQSTDSEDGSDRGSPRDKG